MTHSFIRALLVLVLFIGLRAEAAEAPIAVKMVVVANFENGADSGDKPGEFQLWVEREQLTETLTVRGASRPVRRNAAGLYGLLLENLVPFLLDTRFDFSKTYWLFTGISGADPQIASVGSAAWARWVVNGDEMREIDDREIPAGWPYGLFAIGAMKPNTLPTDANSFGSVESPEELGMAYPLNQGLALWAYGLTRNVVIPDTPALKQQREAWKGFPNAQRPPFVLLGETLGSVRYWHGPGRTQWARDWVKLWTGGKGAFAMTNMESQTAARTMKTYAKLGMVDANRVLVLRTASNPSGPPPGKGALDTIGDEAPGQLAAYEANYRVGTVVVHELMDHWARYERAIPHGALSVDKIYINAEDLLRDALELGMRVVRSGFQPTFLVGVWRGGAPIGITVQEVLEFHGLECDHLAIRTSSYTGIDQQAKTVRVHAIDYLVSRLTAEDRLLLIDDVFDSGLSLEAVIHELRRRCRRNMPEQVRIATAYFKPSRNRSSLMPDFYVRSTDEWLVFPHEMQGLTREEILAHKPVDASFFDATDKDPD